MESVKIPPDIDLQEREDEEAVIRNLTHGDPISPEVVRRIRQRATRISERIWKEHGDIDVDKLLREARDES